MVFEILKSFHGCGNFFIPFGSIPAHASLNFRLRKWHLTGRGFEKANSATMADGPFEQSASPCTVPLSRLAAWIRSNSIAVGIVPECSRYL